MDWAIGGVNTSSNSGGPHCRFYMSDSWRFFESIYVVTLMSLMTWWAFKRLTLPKVNFSHKYRSMSAILVIIFSIVLGIEIGFKLASRTVIYLLNPCHVMTVMQLYLLAAPPSNTVTSVFRVHLNLLNGPILAFLFPETDNRRLPFEKWVYWVQHSLLMIVPYYLLRQGGVYNVEPLRDMSWALFSYGLAILYHFLLLQPLALPISVNLNHMLCPAESDPFSGAYYRTWATLHQMLLCPLACKLFCYLFARDINDAHNVQLIRGGDSGDKEKTK